MVFGSIEGHLVTSSTPTPGWSSVWRLAWHIMLSNLSVPMLGLVATAVVGHLPEAHYLGAVTLGGTLFGFLFWSFGFLRMGDHRPDVSGLWSP
jgi:MATE family multidrug resistance protein